jgi:hypothetical protein
VGLEAWVLFGFAEADAGAFTGGQPVGGVFEGDDAVEDTAFGMADLVRGGLPDGEVGRVGDGIGGDVGGEDLFSWTTLAWDLSR